MSEAGSRGARSAVTPTSSAISGSRGRCACMWERESRSRSPEPSGSPHRDAPPGRLRPPGADRRRAIGIDELASDRAPGAVMQAVNRSLAASDALRDLPRAEADQMAQHDDVTLLGGKAG